MGERTARISAAIGALCIAGMLAAGCGTGRFSVKESREMKTIVEEKEGVRTVLTFLPRKELVARFGEEDNPFLPPERLLSGKDYLVFDLRIEEIQGEGDSGPLVFVLGETELQFAGKVKSPQNQFHFTNYWERIAEKADPRKYNIEKMRMIIKRNIPENEETTAEGPITGMLLFRGNLPSSGRAAVHVPVFDPEGKAAHRFRFEFSF